MASATSAVASASASGVSSPSSSDSSSRAFSNQRSGTFVDAANSMSSFLMSSSSQSTYPSTPIRRYFSRRCSSSIPVPKGNGEFVGIYSPFAALWGLIFLSVPFAYVYIGLILLRLLCQCNPEQIYVPMQHYLPLLAKLVDRMQYSYTVVEHWCWLEGLFYIACKLRISWLQRVDPLEASLSAAPMMEQDERKLLWRRMMECEADDPVTFLSGWFFDEPISNISKYDVRDFVAWSMFEGRHQEHLTTAEQDQLEGFVEEVEWRISLALYGEAEDEVEDNPLSTQEGGSGEMELTAPSSSKPRPPSSQVYCRWDNDLPTPKEIFQFAEESSHTKPNFFSDLYESYKNRYDQMMNSAPDLNLQGSVQDLREMVSKNMPTVPVPQIPVPQMNIHPVKDFRNLMAETRQQITNVEESAMATASQMYETVVPPGSQMDKHLTAMSHATYLKLYNAWDAVKETTTSIQQRLETARFLSNQRNRIRQQLRGYRVMLQRMRQMSSGMPSRQMAAMMRRITECNQAMHDLEVRAQAAFVQATGFARKNLRLLQAQEPRPYAKYSFDPLLGIATYPLGFNLLVLVCTEPPLRVLMQRRGFVRRKVGEVYYYHHPGKGASHDDSLTDIGIVPTLSEEELEFPGASERSGASSAQTQQTPIVFVHGIGIGLIVYMPLIDALLETGRPIFLPEIPYVSGFRPWQSTHAVLPPAAVASTMTAMLATHGYMRSVWMGHSYGTSWLSYMVKYAAHAVSAICFLDPICFCLHVPRLTKEFVYANPDPGTISYIVRTDVIVNWTIQRSFPWAWIILFWEQINVPCAVFLSEKDALVPAEKVERYLRDRHQVPVITFEEDAKPADREAHYSHATNCTIFKGDGHGDWSDRQAATVPTIMSAVRGICQSVESKRIA